MVALGPFPERPRIAVALSGGLDSMALLQLMHVWTAARGGAVIALIVDHGLRRESAEEARRVAGWAGALGVEAAVLPWRGGKPASAIQAQARAARYALLQEACRARGLLFLALAHHRDDQIETLLLRSESGSGSAGLAGMSAVSCLPHVLLLRPLLGMTKEQLRALVQAQERPWVEDSSNRDPRHRRVALRRLRPFLQAQGLGEDELMAMAQGLGRARAVLEREAATWLGANSCWRPEGYAVLDRRILAAAPRPLAEAILGLVLRAIGGRTYRPPSERLQVLVTVAANAGMRETLGGCRILDRQGQIFVVRETRGPEARTLRAGQAGLWDRRFAYRCGGTLPEALRLGPLTEPAWRRMDPRPQSKTLPAVLWSSPCIWDGAGPLALPLARWQRPETARLDISLRFRPLLRPGTVFFSVA